MVFFPFTHSFSLSLKWSENTPVIHTEKSIFRCSKNMTKLYSNNNNSSNQQHSTRTKENGSVAIVIVVEWCYGCCCCSRFQLDHLRHLCTRKSITTYTTISESELLAIMALHSVEFSTITHMNTHFKPIHLNLHFHLTCIYIYFVVSALSSRFVLLFTNFSASSMQIKTSFCCAIIV